MAFLKKEDEALLREVAKRTPSIGHMTVVVCETGSLLEELAELTVISHYTQVQGLILEKRDEMDECKDKRRLDSLQTAMDALVAKRTEAEKVHELLRGIDKREPAYPDLASASSDNFDLFKTLSNAFKRMTASQHILKDICSRMVFEDGDADFARFTVRSPDWSSFALRNGKTPCSHIDYRILSTVTPSRFRPIGSKF